jgi:hypothetical protein
LSPWICSSEYSVWNWAYGLFVECRWFFSAIFAKCSGVEPYMRMCSAPAEPNIHAAGGPAISEDSDIASMCFAMGGSRSP